VPHTVINVVDDGMNLQEAVDAPRFHQQWLPDVTDLERFAGASCDATRPVILRNSADQLLRAPDAMRRTALRGLLHRRAGALPQRSSWQASAPGSRFGGARRRVASRVQGGSRQPAACRFLVSEVAT
jgi:hypothetical protein